MISLDLLFKAAAKGPAHVNSGPLLAPASFTCPKPPRTENCSRDALFWFLVDKQIIDIHGKIICEVPTDIPELNSTQKERLNKTLAEPIPVYDRNGKQGFEISFNEIIGYVNEFYRNAVRRPRIELVGGWVAKILDLTQDPLQVFKKFNIPGIEEFLKNHPLGENYRDPPDRDLRIAIEGASKAERNALFEFILTKIGERTGRSSENLKLFLTDVINPQDEANSNCFLMFGMGDRYMTNIEVIACDKLRRKELFSPENVKISLPSSEFSFDQRYLQHFWQGFFDRLLQRTRVYDPETLDHFIWFKSHLYAIQGLTIADSQNSNIVRDKFYASLSDDELYELLQIESIKILTKHCRQESLNAIAYLYTLREELVKLKKEHLWDKLYSGLKNDLPTIFPGQKSTYPTEKIFYRLFECEIPNFDLFKTLVHLFAWICSKGEGDHKEKECRTRSTRNGSEEAIELILKGSDQNANSMGRRSDYSFWMTFKPKEVWETLLNTSIDDTLLRMFLELFISDLKTNNMFGSSDGFDWKEFELERIAQTLLATHASEKFRLGFWITLISTHKNSNAFNTLLRIAPRYFLEEQNVQIKIKAAEIFDLLRQKYFQNSSGAIIEALKNGDQSSYLLALIENDNWYSIGIELWKKKYPEPTWENLNQLGSKLKRWQSWIEVLEIVKSRQTLCQNSQFEAFIQTFLSHKEFNKSAFTPELHNWIVESLIGINAIHTAINWIDRMGASITTFNWRNLLENSGDHKEKALTLIQRLGVPGNVEKLWDYATVDQKLDDCRKAISNGNLVGGFNSLEILAKAGVPNTHSEKFRIIVLEAFQQLVKAPLRTSGLMWEFIQAINLIKYLPSDSKLKTLWDMVRKLEDIVSEYCKTHESSWYVGVAHSYFSLAVQESLDQASHNLDMSECVMIFLERVNYPAYPITTEISQRVLKLFGKLVPLFVNSPTPSKILAFHHALSNRNIVSANDTNTRDALILGYARSALPLPKPSVVHLETLLRDFLADDARAPELVLETLIFIELLEDEQLAIQLFKAVYQINKDKALECIEKRLKGHLNSNRLSQSQKLFDLEEFASRRSSLGETLFGLYVSQNSSDEELKSGYNLLKSNPLLPAGLWKKLFIIASVKGSTLLMGEIWTYFTENVSSGMGADNRSMCWLFGLRGLLRCSSPEIGRLDRDTVEQVFNDKSADPYRNDGRLLYLEASVKFAVTREKSEKDRCIPALRNARDAVLNQIETLSEKERDRLVELSFDLNEMECPDQLSQLKLCEKLIPLCRNSSIPRLVKLINSQMKIQEGNENKNDVIHVGYKIYSALAVKSKVEVLEKVMNTLTSFSRESRDTTHLSVSIRACHLLREQANAHASSFKRVLEILKGYISGDDVLTNKLDLFRDHFQFMIQRQMLSTDELASNVETYTIARLFNTFQNSPQTIDTIEDLLDAIFNDVLTLKCNKLWQTGSFREKLNLFLIELLKRSNFRIFAKCAVLIDYYSLKSSDVTKGFLDDHISKNRNRGWLIIGNDEKKYITSSMEIYQWYFSQKQPSAMFESCLFGNVVVKEKLVKSVEACKVFANIKMENIRLALRCLQDSTQIKLITKDQNGIFVRGFLLDFILRNFQTLFKCLPCCKELKQEVFVLFDQFFFMVDRCDIYYQPHYNTQLNSTEGNFGGPGVVYTTNILCEAAKDKIFNDCPIRFAEYAAHASFYWAFQTAWKEQKFKDQDLIQGIKNWLFIRHKGDVSYQLERFREWASNSIPIAKKMLLLPLLKDFLKMNSEFLKKNRQSFVNITKTWLTNMCEEVLKSSEWEITQEQLFNYFNDNIFDDDFIAEHYKFLINEILNDPSESATSFANYIFTNAIKNKKIKLPQLDHQVNEIYSKLQKRLHQIM